MTSHESKRKMIQLDVGGTLYKVSRQTLERCEGSMLASLISDHWKEGNADINDPIFIDRNGLLFQFVIDYLRAGEIHLPITVSLEAVKNEFDFYGIDADVSKVITKHGVKYCHSLKEQAIALDMEIRASRISAQAEYEFWKSNTNPSTLCVVLAPADRVVLHEHEHVLRERLLARGMVLVASHSTSGYVNVSRASSCLHQE